MRKSDSRTIGDPLDDRTSGITVALVRARNPEQAIQNAKAADIILTPEELQFINQQIDQMLK